MNSKEMYDMGFTILDKDIEKARNDVRTAIGIFKKFSLWENKSKEDLVEAGEMLIYYFSKLSDMQLTYTNEMIMINKSLASIIQGETTPIS